MDEISKKGSKKKEKKIVPMGIVHIQATFNNAIITITDLQGNVVSWASCRNTWFQGFAQRHTVCGTTGCSKLRSRSSETWYETRTCSGKRTGAGRESAIRALQSIGLEIKSIKDVTPIPHNGCRPPKRRSV